MYVDPRGLEATIAVGAGVAVAASGAAAGAAAVAVATPALCAASGYAGLRIGGAIDNAGYNPLTPVFVAHVNAYYGAKDSFNSWINKYGSRGRPDHQARVRDLLDKAREEAGPGETVVQEQRIRGYDTRRCPDVQIRDKDNVTRKVFEAERRPNSKRNREREDEYDRLGIPYETHPVIIN